MVFLTYRKDISQKLNVKRGTRDFIFDSYCYICQVLTKPILYMNFNKVNNIVGWIVCAIACTVYLMTMEATASLWDCGEFISSTFKMQVPHPPGAPLFVILGRLFIVVEGEVYAMSSLFTALVFWAMLKWEHNADKQSADKWIIFIFFMMGLSIGVHLLNLLTIPAIVMIYYFKRYTVTPWGTFWAF